MKTHEPRRLVSITHAVKALLVVTALQMVLLPACGKKSTPMGPSTATAVSPSLVALTITASNTLTGPGQTAQLTATAAFSDNTTKDVTSVTRWGGGDPKVATVSAAGLMAAVDYGEMTIFANYLSRSATMLVSVLPPGTFVLSGRITEPINLSVGGATVQAMDGPYAGRSQTADAYGNYKLSGIAGSLTLRVGKDGYLPSTQVINVVSRQKLDVELQPATAPAAVAGDYSLTVTASASCQLPDEARNRMYSAEIVQQGAGITVTLGGANFASSGPGAPGNRFTGRVVGNVVNFVLGYDDYYGIYDVVERLAPTTYLTFGGSATEQAGQTTMSASLVGTVAVFETSNWPDYNRKTVAACTANDHLLTLTRGGSPTSVTRRR